MRQVFIMHRNKNWKRCPICFHQLEKDHADAIVEDQLRFLDLDSTPSTETAFALA
jgi:hypothetical protein